MQRIIKRNFLTLLFLLIFSSSAYAVNVNYIAHMASTGWQAWTNNGKTAGATKKAQSIDGVKISVTEGGIMYRVYVNSKGWQSWTGNGQTAGIIGKKLPIEAIEIQLLNGLENKYHVEYRVRLVKKDWQPWVKDGKTAGIIGRKQKIDAIEIRLSVKLNNKPENKPVNTNNQNINTNTNATSKNANDNYVTKVRQFLNDSRWKPGTSWGPKNKPKISPWKCSGCMAFAADFVKFVFDKNSPRAGTGFTKLNETRAGDILYVSSPHWIVVLARIGNSLETIEGNWPNDKGVRSIIRAKGVYTIEGNNLMRNGKKYSNFSSGWHFR